MQTCLKFKYFDELENKMKNILGSVAYQDIDGFFRQNKSKVKNLMQGYFFKELQLSYFITGLNFCDRIKKLKIG
jgi:hypothetical protein